MQKNAKLPWEAINNYVLTCGNVHDPIGFVHAIIDNLSGLISFDQGVAMVLDESHHICDQHLVNMDTRWINMYVSYYSHLVDARWDYRVDNVSESFAGPYVEEIVWGDEPHSEFLANYIMARGLKYSLTFSLFDNVGRPRAAFSLDRMQKRFSEHDQAVLRCAVMQLNNLFKNFFVDYRSISGSQPNAVDAKLARSLTKRELEVVDLLCQGLSPSYVATTLHISVSTAYKHIAHIYKKLGVSSQQELLVYVLNAR